MKQMFCFKMVKKETSFIDGFHYELRLGSWSFIRHHWSYNSWIEYQWTLSWARQCKNFPFRKRKRTMMFSFQFGNTCYCNSVLQALYFCKPFRERVLNYRLTQKNKKENLLICLADLFHMIVSGKRRTGALQPKKFINKLRKENSKTFLLFWTLRKNKLKRTNLIFF